MSEATPVLTEVGSSIDTAIEGLRWCRQHLQDRTVTLRLRELEQTIGALALALDLEMDGEAAKAKVALENSSWKPRAKGQSIQEWMWQFEHMYDH
jgi:uncharacterized protein HemX